MSIAQQPLELDIFLLIFRQIYFNIDLAVCVCLCECVCVLLNVSFDHDPFGFFYGDA